MGIYGRNDDRRPLREFDGPLEGGRFRADHGTRQRRAAEPQRTGAPQRKLAAANRRPGTAPRARRPKSRRGKMAIIGLGIVIAFVLAAQSLMQQNVGTGRRSAPTQEETAHSTPAHAWRKGEVPFLYQIDPQWSDEPYAGGNIHENGCGPTCLSMVYISLTGKTDLDPVAMARFSEQNGFTVDGMTAWALMTDGAAMLGLHSAELSASADVVRAELEAGRPIICSVRPGDFTSTGHFIVLAGLTDDGQVMVRDPNNAGNGDHPWDLDRILGQCANLWSFSA